MQDWRNCVDPARISVGAMQLHGWTTILCLSGTQLSGVDTIVWPMLLKLPFKSPTLHDHFFLVRTSICMFLDYVENSLSLESNHIKLAAIEFILYLEMSKYSSCCMLNQYLLIFHFFVVSSLQIRTSPQNG